MAPEADIYRNPPVRTGAGWGWILGYGVLSIALGIAAFVFPYTATLTATFVVGWFFLAAGAVSVIAGLAGRGHHGRGYAIGFGILSVVIGILMIAEPLSGALSLTLLVAVWLGVRGAMEIGWGSRFRRGRGLMIALGVINILLAVYVVVMLPWSALTLPGFVLAVSFMLGGINAIASAMAHKRDAPAFAMPA